MVALKARKRETAQKVWIVDLINSPFTAAEGWNPSTVQVDGRKVARASILATVVAKFASEAGNYASITMDDGTETIRSKAFGPDVAKFANARPGALVRFIGKVKEYNSERYLKPEIVHEVTDPNWVIVQKIELSPPDAAPPAPEDTKSNVPEHVAENAIKEEDLGVQAKILNLIRTMANAEGADMDLVMAQSQMESEDAKNIIIGLLKAGEIYEPKKGRLKVLD